MNQPIASLISKEALNEWPECFSGELESTYLSKVATVTFAIEIFGEVLSLTSENVYLPYQHVMHLAMPPELEITGQVLNVISSNPDVSEPLLVIHLDTLIGSEVTGQNEILAIEVCMMPDTNSSYVKVTSVSSANSVTCDIEPNAFAEIQVTDKLSKELVYYYSLEAPMIPAYTPRAKEELQLFTMGIQNVIETYKEEITPYRFKIESNIKELNKLLTSNKQISFYDNIELINKVDSLTKGTAESIRAFLIEYATGLKIQTVLE